MPVSLSGSILITGSMTTSGTITAQTLVVQTITSSIVNMTGSNIFGSQLGDRQTFTGSMFVTGSGTFTSTISAIGESTLFRGVFNDPVPNTAAVLKMSSTPTPSALSTVVGARMTGNATANFDSYAGYFSNLTVSSGTGLSYGIFATASFHTFIGETRLAQGVFNDPIAGTAASVKISATPVSGYPTAVFTAGATGAASSNQNTYAGYFTNTTTVSGTGVNYGIYATGSSHYLGGNVGIGTTTPTQLLDVVGTTTGTYTTSTQQVVSRIYNLPASLGSGINSAFISLQTSPDGGASNPIARIGVVAETYGSNNGTFVVATRDSGGITERMRITSAGNVGIQTTAPASKLHVAGAGNAAGGNIIMGQINDSTAKWSYLVSTQYNSSTQPQGFTLIGGYSTATVNQVVIGGSIYEANPSTEIQFWTHTAVSHSLGGSQKMTITSAGNVGIGISSPNSLLTVNGSIAVLGAGAFTSNYTVAATDTWLTAYSLSTTCVVTLPTPASNTGRMLFIRTQSAQLVNSASSNVTSLATGAVGTAILSATAGKWALLFCDGTYWNIFAAN